MWENRLLVLGAILFPPIGLWKLLHWYIRPESVQDRKEVLLIVAQTFAGALLLGGLFFTGLNIRATEKSVEIARENTLNNLKIAEETLRISQEGQITERFTRAIEQLGNDKLEIRLGAIYALERISKDSEADRPSIMEVLTAYVRENAPWTGDEPSEREQEPLQLPKLATDIQAILTVIGRREPISQGGEPQRLDLRNTDLHGANLPSANLQGMYLREVNLNGASLKDANFEGSVLVGASLKGANLYAANLRKASLTDANLKEAKLFNANLEEAVLHAVNLQDAFLVDANLKETTLIKANLGGAVLLRAHLEGSNLLDANLEGSNLQGADLTHAIGLTQHQIDSAIIDSGTKFPSHIK